MPGGPAGWPAGRINQMSRSCQAIDAPCRPEVQAAPEHAMHELMRLSCLVVLL